MAYLHYNDVDLSPFLRTLNVTQEPVMDPTGVDYWYTHVVIEVMGVFNPQAVTPPGPVLNAPGGLAGGLPGATIADFRDRLSKPRHALLYEVVPGDNCVVSPGQTPNGQPLACDCNNGPDVMDLRVTEIHGTKSAIFYFKVQTWLSKCSNVVLSNRWSIRCSTDRHGYTTRITSGRIKLRADYAQLLGLTADAFRAACFLPTPDLFQRYPIEVTVTEDGTEAEYTVTDTEQPLALGANSMVTDIEGNATAGTEMPFHNLKEAIDWSQKTAAMPWTAFKNGFWNLPDTIKAGASLLPTNRASCLVRVYGSAAASKQELAKVAVLVALDRFTPLFFAGLKPFIISAFLTQDLKERVVELRVEFMVSAATGLGTFLHYFDFGRLMNLAEDILGPPGLPLNYTAHSGQCPRQTHDSNSRGSYVGALLVQALSQDCTPPAAPPASANAPSKPLNVPLTGG